MTSDQARALRDRSETRPPGISAEVAEFQGLYGAYHVGEILLQKIWLRGSFDQSRARISGGESISVVHPGTWNRLSGPDFRGARVIIAGREITGDIEVHFQAEAWKHHGHHLDPDYDNVILHVVLYPQEANAEAARTSDGRTIPTLALVDLLWHDLEEYVVDDAVMALSGRDAMPLVEYLMGLSPEERATVIRDAALRRWREKVHFARVRIERCGWEEACHLTALEILGYRSNREAMLKVGTALTWSAWQDGTGGASGPTIDDLVAAGGAAWTLRGVRPANQPRQRLEQYRRWMAKVPDWPLQLKKWSLPNIREFRAAEHRAPVLALRRRAGLPALRAALARDLAGDQIGGVRMDTLVVNLVLPFLAHDPAKEPAAERWWGLWAPGDVPEVLAEASRRLSDPKEREIRTSLLVQGLLGLHLQRAFSSAAGL